VTVTWFIQTKLSDACATCMLASRSTLMTGTAKFEQKVRHRYMVVRETSADPALHVDRTRVIDVFTKALSTDSEVHSEETFIVDWQFDHIQPDGSRIQCFCQLYPTGGFTLTDHTNIL
jgi:hypothetical protein